MQSTHGNAHVARLLSQQRSAVLGRIAGKALRGTGNMEAWHGDLPPGVKFLLPPFAALD